MYKHNEYNYYKSKQEKVEKREEKVKTVKKFYRLEFKMLSIRSITLFKQPISCLSILNLEQQKCGLKMHKSEPPPKMTIPTKSKLPILPKIPAEFTNFYGKIPKGMTTYNV